LSKTKTKTKPPSKAARKPAARSTSARRRPSSAASSKGGRPAGSRTRPRDEVMCDPSRCKACGSTNRIAYSGKPIVQFAPGKDPQGRPFTHVITRNTECSDCHQRRRDVSYLNDPSKTAQQVAGEIDGTNNE
jgi:hypothetical protein